ncbi:hypothetical protein BV20DRAFT_968223 [Pilatotrama ljubarskyi]|nr:hypothetical protein BV20DRAFT_968223 [Pilatotrama ljubarskyi]
MRGYAVHLPERISHICIVCDNEATDLQLEKTIRASALGNIGEDIVDRGRGTREARRVPYVHYCSPGDAGFPVPVLETDHRLESGASRIQMEVACRGSRRVRASRHRCMAGRRRAVRQLGIYLGFRNDGYESIVGWTEKQHLWRPAQAPHSRCASAASEAKEADAA